MFSFYTYGYEKLFTSNQSERKVADIRYNGSIPWNVKALT